MVCHGCAPQIFPLEFPPYPMLCLPDELCIAEVLRLTLFLISLLSCFLSCVPHIPLYIFPWALLPSFLNFPFRYPPPPIGDFCCAPLRSLSLSCMSTHSLPFVLPRPFLQTLLLVLDLLYSISSLAFCYPYSLLFVYTFCFPLEACLRRNCVPVSKPKTIFFSLLSYSQKCRTGEDTSCFLYFARLLHW